MVQYQGNLEQSNTTSQPVVNGLWRGCHLTYPVKPHQHKTLAGRLQRQQACKYLTFFQCTMPHSPPPTAYICTGGTKVGLQVFLWKIMQ